MSAVNTSVSDQLNIDKAALFINIQLDSIDNKLIARGQDDEGMMGDYQNQLAQYKQALDRLGRNTDQQEHELCLAINPDLFANLKNTINLIPADRYEQAILKVQETLMSRIQYFKALMNSLPIGRLSNTQDVAWFHRNNRQLIDSYSSQHIKNKELLMAKTITLEKHCDFKETKFGVAKWVELSTRFVSNLGDQFFISHDDLHYQASNYFRLHLHESLIALANNNTIIDSETYLNSIADLQERFLLKLEKLVPDNKADSIAVSEKAITLIKLVAIKKLIPLFIYLKEQLTASNKQSTGCNLSNGLNK
ncbi:MAG: hypothetical protein PSV35_06645 [bacterium]|nr:hypothetical protein [bacterium]